MLIAKSLLLLYNLYLCGVVSFRKYGHVQLLH